MALALLLPALGLAPLYRKMDKRGRRVLLLMLLILVMVMIGMAGCGGSHGYLDRAPQTYTLRLVATTASGLSHFTTFSLTVR